MISCFKHQECARFSAEQISILQEQKSISAKQGAVSPEVLALFPVTHIQQPGALFYLYLPVGEPLFVLVVTTLKPIWNSDWHRLCGVILTQRHRAHTCRCQANEPVLAVVASKSCMQVW